MPPRSGSSVLGNLIAQRAQLSKVRQRIGLEGSNPMPQSNMRPAGPVPGPASASPGAAPAAKVGPQAQAVMTAGSPMGGFRMPAHETEAPPPEVGQNMQAMADAFMAQHGPAYQKSRGAPAQAAPAAAAPAPRPAPAAGGTPGGAPATAAGTPSAAQAPSVAAFVQQMKRLPTAQELSVLYAQRTLQQQNGRPPMVDELRQFLTPQQAAP